MHTVFDRIQKFREWASTQERKYGEWECNYAEWNEIYALFGDFIDAVSFAHWDPQQIAEILYILARDNETQTISRMIANDESLLLFLAEQSRKLGEPDAKWQLAVRLSNCIKREAAETL